MKPVSIFHCVDLFVSKFTPDIRKLMTVFGQLVVLFFAILATGTDPSIAGMLPGGLSYCIDHCLKR